MSDEARARLSERMKNNNPMKDKVQKEALSKRIKEQGGIRRKPPTKAERAATSKRMREANPMKDPDVAERVAEQNRGAERPGWTPERRAKMEDWIENGGREVLSKANKGRVVSEAERERISKMNKGKKRSAEARARMSAAAKRRVLRDAQARGGTAPELEVRKQLEALGEDFREQHTFDGSGFVWDFAIPSRRILIEVDGCYWHGCEPCGFDGHPDNRKNDLLKNQDAASRGWNLIRLKECQLCDSTLKDMLKAR